MSANTGAHIPASEAVGLGAPLPLHLPATTTINNTANPNNNNEPPSFSQAPTLAPSNSSGSGSDHGGSSSDEKQQQQKQHQQPQQQNYKKSSNPLGDAEKGGFATGEEDQEDHQNTGSSIDVEKSKAQFAALSRQMSQSSALHRQKSRQSQLGSGGKNNTATDLEKQRSRASSTRGNETENDDDEDDFDLLEYIRGQTRKADEEGFKHKKLTVVWENLKVVGGGGLKVSSHQHHYCHPF